MQETRVRSMGQGDPLEKEMATHFSILAWRIPWTEEAGELQSMGLQESDRIQRLTHTWYTGPKEKSWPLSGPAKVIYTLLTSEHV